MKYTKQRMLIRWIHIVGGGIIATFIYSPWRDNYIFQMAVKAVVVPLLIISGLWLWKGHLIFKK